MANVRVKLIMRLFVIILLLTGRREFHSQRLPQSIDKDCRTQTFDVGTIQLLEVFSLVGFHRIESLESVAGSFLFRHDFGSLSVMETANQPSPTVSFPPIWRYVSL